MLNVEDGFETWSNVVAVQIAGLIPEPEEFYSSLNST
jgi:hypothetical protein